MAQLHPVTAALYNHMAQEADRLRKYCSELERKLISLQASAREMFKSRPAPMAELDFETSCPRCGRMSGKSGGVRLEDGFLVVEFICESCGCFTWHRWYSFSHITSGVDKKYKDITIEWSRLELEHQRKITI
jgi:hypothetical protein